MTGGIERRAAKVSLVTGLSTLMSIVFQLVSVPICLRFWGKDTYGNWLAIFAAFILLRSLDTGFISYVGNKLNSLYHLDQFALRKHLASAFAGTVIIGAAQLLIGVGALYSNAIDSFMGMTAEFSSNHRSGLALLVLVASWALSGPYMGIVHRLMIPTGLLYQVSWWSMGFQVTQFMGIILSAMRHLDMLQTSLLFAFVQVAVYLASAIYIRLKLPDYYPWWKNGSIRTGMDDLWRSMSLMASNFVQQGTTNGAVILLSVLSGPAAVPVFTTIRTLTNIWSSVTNVLTSPLLPDVVRYRAMGEWEKLVSISKVYWVLVGTAVNLGILLTYPLIAPVYAYWTARKLVLDKSLLCLLLSSIVVANIGGLMTLYLNGVNNLASVMAASVIRGVMALAVGGALFFHFGLDGFGMGVLGGELLALLATGWFFWSEFYRHGVELHARSLVPVFLSASSTLLFLSNEGLNYFPTDRAFLPALLGVSVAAVGGWKGLDLVVRDRLAGILGIRFPGKDVA